MLESREILGTDAGKGKGVGTDAVKQGGVGDGCLEGERGRML